jgi:carboxyl-terminal processing protease
MHKNKDGVFSLKPDSLKQHFRTLHGRDVVEAGGIYPDSTVMQDSTNEFLSELVRRAVIFKFAVAYANANKNIQSDFTITENILKEFKNYLKEKKFEYKDETEKKLNEISQLASSKKYSREFMNEIKLLEKSAKSEKDKDFERSDREIKMMLENEIVGVAKGQTEQIANSLKYDNQLKIAVNILKNKKLYNKFLNIRN